MSKQYIEVAVTLPLYQTYTYAVPVGLNSRIKVGKRLLVPFGPRRLTAYAVGHAQPENPESIKNIIDVLDDAPLFPHHMVALFKWIADYYIYPIGLVIKSALPGGLHYAEKAVLALTDDGRQTLERDILTPIEKQVLEKLLPNYYRNMARLTAGLSENERQTMLSLLSKINRKLNSLFD